MHLFWLISELCSATFIIFSSTHNTDAQSGSQSNLSGPTSLLTHPLTATLPPLISFLRQALAPLPRRRALHVMATEASRVLFDSVLMRQRFSAAGAMQFAVDVNAIRNVIDAGLVDTGPTSGIYTKTGTGVRGMERVDAALRLLTLPTEDDIKRDGEGRLQEPEAQTNKADSSHPTIRSEGVGTWSDDKAVTLWYAERMLFASNEHAHEFLSSLGTDVMEAISNSDARSILARRVELEG